MSKVLVYTTPTCPYCIRAKQLLASRGVEYEERNVSGNAAAADEMAEKSGQRAVPVLDIEGTIIVGYDPKRIEEALAALEEG